MLVTGFGFDPNRGLLIESVLILSGERWSTPQRSQAVTHIETDIVPMCLECGAPPKCRVHIIGFLGTYCEMCFYKLPRVVRES